MDQLKKAEKDQKFYQDFDAHSLRNETIVRVAAIVVYTGFAIIGFFWFIDNAIVPLVKMFHG